LHKIKNPECAASRPPGLPQALFVAQICNLLYRRIAFGGPFECSHAWKLRRAGELQLGKCAQDRSPMYSGPQLDAALGIEGIEKNQAGIVVGC
jgi:hypothetical protein